MKIPIKKYVMDKSLSWEERYKKLEAHHTEETKWMFEKLKQYDEVVQAAIEMKTLRGWAFTMREDIFGDKWGKLEKLITKISKGL